MLKKKWLLGACGALLAGGLFASVASANLVITPYITGIDGVPLGLSGDAASGFAIDTSQWLKAAQITHAGQTFQIDFVYTITGSATSTSSANFGLNSLVGSVASQLTAPGTASAGRGHFTANGYQQVQGDNSLVQVFGVGDAAFTAPPSVGIGGAVGAATGQLGASNLDDGSPDIGSGPRGDSSGFIVIGGGGTSVVKFTTNGNAAAPWTGMLGYTPIVPDPDNLPDGTLGGDPIYPYNIAGGGAVPGTATTTGPWLFTSAHANAGISDVIASCVWTYNDGGVKDAQTAINWMPWIDDTTGIISSKAAQWMENSTGTAVNRTSSATNFSVGAPVVLTNNVPEPASLSVLALGALGLLARRRK